MESSKTERGGCRSYYSCTVSCRGKSRLRCVIAAVTAAQGYSLCEISLRRMLDNVQKASAPS